MSGSVTTWVVKDTDGEVFEITAEKLQISANGLIFKSNDEIVAFFERFANYGRKGTLKVLNNNNKDKRNVG